ncbi:MAG: type II secretion system protein [Planctomycetota bacterium]|jgi:prepilin-type N-terminal cleavage/methylation domain-containing protein/prepilin-type processing-associated H-X9-DG protein
MRRVGFTLVELLVVIAVIALLMGILLPVMRAVRLNARAVVCSSNLKQISLALATYDHENGTFPQGFDDLTYQWVPPPGGYVGEMLFDKRGGWWFQFLKPSLGEHFGQKGLLWCPSRTVQDPTPRANVLCGNYGVNRAICRDAPGAVGGKFVGKPLSTLSIRPPEATLLVLDSGYSLLSWCGAIDSNVPLFENPKRVSSFYLPGLRINKERTILRGCEQDAVDGRHPRKTVNAGFVDGHVNKLKADDLLVQESDGTYINRSPLWVPRLSKSD